MFHEKLVNTQDPFIQNRVHALINSLGFIRALEHEGIDSTDPILYRGSEKIAFSLYCDIKDYGHPVLAKNLVDTYSRFAKMWDKQEHERKIA